MSTETHAPTIADERTAGRGAGGAAVQDADLEELLEGSELDAHDRETMRDLADFAERELTTALLQNRTVEMRHGPRVPRTARKSTVVGLCQWAGRRAWRAMSRRGGAGATVSVDALIQGSNEMLAELLDPRQHASTQFSADARRNLMEQLLRGEGCREAAEEHGVALKERLLLVTMPADEQSREQLARLTAHPGVLGHELEDVVVVVSSAPSIANRAELRKVVEGQLLRGSQDKVHAAVALVEAHRDVPSAMEDLRTILKLAVLLEYPVGVYSTEDLPIEMALLRAPDVMSLLASRLLPLQTSGAPLVETLRVYLSLGQNRRHASKKLFIHPNTLDYRLRRVRELTGLTATVPRDIQVLGAALTALQLSDLA